MIWTVVLKDGHSFVIYESRPDIYNCYNAVEARGFALSDIAGIVPGKHEVLTPPILSKSQRDSKHRARRASLEAPEISPLANDPIDW